ncbi:DUF1045 domain-containing protein [Roseovarius sp. SCSIO 43702]|nr:DUF1045 domain-containing protein [Roseovarius sp. SCSIO 43702]
MQFSRVAIYHSFAPAPWSDWATRWLGHDLATGAPVGPPPNLAAAPAAWTEAPRRYGLHATLKPPFVLGGGSRDLRAEFRQFCDGRAPVTVGALRLAPLGRFLALVPERQPAALSELAARVVRDFDRFRAPPSDAELDRRRGAGLAPPLEENLRRWGYPHVMEAFRYHVTLTGKLPRAARDDARAILETHLAPLLPQSLTLDALSLVGEDAEGRFHLVERRALSGSGGG